MIVLVLLLCVLFEVTTPFMPFVLIALLLCTIKTRSDAVFLYATFCGLLLDVLMLRTIGTTAFFLTTYVLLILLYQRKFEIATYHFIFLSAFFGTALYIIIFGGGNSIIISVASATFSVLVFAILTNRKVSPKKHFF